MPTFSRIRGRPLAALAVVATRVGVATWMGKGNDPRPLPAQLGGGVPPLCDPRFCGNGEPDPGEQCDDANNADGDGCDALCRLECAEDIECPSGECSGGTCTNLCGNGVVDPATCTPPDDGTDAEPTCSLPEECDDGILNGQPGRCSIRCTLCGNGAVDAGEQCDDSNSNSEDGCSSSCKREFCGDGTTQAELGEECDEPRVCVNPSGGTGFECYYDPVHRTCQPTPTSIPVLLALGIRDFPFACTFDPRVAAPLCGGNFCSPSASCTDACTLPDSACNGDGLCSASESCTCHDCFGASRCSACNLDAVCDAGEGCSCGDCSGEASCQTHTACDVATQRCVSVPGVGTNGCEDDVDCARTQHLACVGRTCAMVDGPGMDLCDIGDPIDCADDEHRQCDLLFQTCEIVDGAAEDQCETDGNCATMTLACVGEQCVPVPGTDEPSCSTNESCIAACNGDGLCSESEDCTCSDCFGESRCSACDLDAQCDAGEDCGCSDCSDEPACQTHLECVDEQCVSVPGVGVNECDDDVDCARTQHLACVGRACAMVDGPGMDLCDIGDPIDCADDEHRQCDLLFQTCEMVAGAAEDQCEDDGNCADMTLACVGEQCKPVPGTDEPSCHSESCRTSQCGNGAVEGAEQCDEGELNGVWQGNECRYMTCNADCTLPRCGDGTVNACTWTSTIHGGEECDDGDENGQPGSTCNAQCVPTSQCNLDGLCAASESCACLDCMGAERCNACNGDGQCDASESCSCGDCSAEPSCQTHTGCDPFNDRCVSIAGAGTNDCTTDAHCERTQRLKCVNRACAIVDEPGMDLCDADDDCLDDEHRQCDFLFQTCEIVGGAAQDQCADGGDCDDLTLACVGEQCAVVPGTDFPSCGTSEQCEAQCNLDGQCADNESCTCLDCTDDLRCAACDGDNQCELGESCGCGDCADTPSCIAHTECDPFARQCIVVLGPGTNDCTSDAHCTNTERLACVNQACTIVQESGIDLCAIDADCCDPADPTCVHRQCNPFTQSCITQPGPAPDGCDGDANCTEFHSECSGEQCVIVEGAGESECLDATQCGVLCGNDLLDPGEDCDEGPDNRTGPPDDLGTWYCKAGSCTYSACIDEGDNDSDGLLDAFDAGCWEYDLSGLAANDGARSFLGWLIAQNNDILEPIPPERLLPGKDDEACPAETVDRGSFCALRCEPGDICPGDEPCPEDGVCPVLCPNGAIDTVLGITEECDDGNLIDDDLCSNICRLNSCTGTDCPRCGDGVYQPEIGEQCDDGNENNEDECTNNCRIRCDDDDDCLGDCDLSTNQCLPPLCGDGEVNQEWERCDDGDLDNGNACNNQCQPVCHGDADCESGACDEERLVCIPLCGNGRHDSGEQCDDGNVINNDSCSNQCQRRCTDDAACDCDELRGVCRDPCGNGRLDDGEQCDDGNEEDRDQCNNRCQLRCRPGTLCPDQQACPQNGVCNPAPACGDGIVNGAEQCDDANAVDGDGCTNACTLRCDQSGLCPNGLVCAGQECVECSSSLQCRDGFCVDGRCRQALPLCGNGVTEPGEACDDGNADNADGCTTRCSYPTGHACTASGQCHTRLCQGGTCQLCSDAGQCGSGLRCSQGNCLFGPATCGDGTVQAGESCDDANLNEQDQCTSACLLAFGAACSHAAQCQSTICSDGACAPCRSDTECASGRRCAIGLCLTDAQLSVYPNVCGNGFTEGDEACDDGNARYGDGCTPTCDIGNSPVRREVAANVAVQLPFVPLPGTNPSTVHGAGLSDTGPATVAVMAAGAAAGTAWVRRRWKRKRR